MKKKNKILIVGVVIFIFLAFIFFRNMKYQGAPEITQYESTIEMQDNGTLRQNEKVNYRIGNPVKQLLHNVTTGTDGKLTDFNMTLTAEHNGTPFTFMSSSNQEVGTYETQRNNDKIAIKAYNPMEKDDFVANYKNEITRGWILYGNRAILNLNLASLPYPIKQGKLTINFPKAINDLATRAYVGGNEVKDWKIEDNKRIVIDLSSAQKNQGIEVLIALPKEALGGDLFEGPASKGEQLVEKLNQEIKKKEEEQRRRFLLLIGLEVAIVLFMLLYLWAYKRYKDRLQDRQPGLSLVQLSLLERLVFLEDNKASLFFSVVAQLLQNRQLIWQGDSWLKQGEGANPAEKWVLDSFEKGFPSKNLQRRINRRLRKEGRRLLNERGLNDRIGTALFKFLLLPYFLLTLVTIVFSVYFMRSEGFLWLLLPVILMIFALVIWKKGFPILSGTGRRLHQDGLKYKKALKSSSRPYYDQKIDEIMAFVWNIEGWIKNQPSSSPLIQTLRAHEIYDKKHLEKGLNKKNV